MSQIRTVAVPDEAIESPFPFLFRQSPADDLGRASVVAIFRCCVCGETHLILDEIGAGYVHVTGCSILCVMCEHEAKKGLAS